MHDFELQSLLPKLQQGLAQYEVKLSSQYGREFIEVKDNYVRGARIYLTKQYLQVVPMAPTFRGRYISGNTGGAEPKHIKNFFKVSEESFHLLREVELPEGIELSLLRTVEQLEQTEKGERIGYFFLIGFGVAMFAFAAFLYITFQDLETEGGEIRMNWLFVLLYETFGKEVTAVVVSLIGVSFLYQGGKGLRKMAKAE
ncbi:MAG: hypothetical protein AAGM67_08970 [Bacteroidota bacterium]